MDGEWKKLIEQIKKNNIEAIKLCKQLKSIFTDINMKNGKYQEHNGIMWYKDDKRHRDDGPACEYNNGNKAWWQNGKIHRIGAPAVQYHDGCLVYYYNGLRHRLDGPAAIYPNGDVEYWINGKEFGTIEQYEKEIIRLTS